jgi:hypothetical protein
VQRCKFPLRRQSDALVLRDTHTVEGGDEELLLVGYQPVEAERKMSTLAKGRRLRHGVAERGRGAVDEAVFDLEVPRKNVVCDRVVSNLAKESMTDRRVPSGVRLRTHLFGKRDFALIHRLATHPIDETFGAFWIDRVPPAAIDLQRTGDDDAINDGENVAHVL